MTTMQHRWSVCVLLVPLAALNTWRACTQSFTIDEAYSYQNFSSTSTSAIFETFHSNHHLLFTVLSKLSCEAFGVSGRPFSTSSTENCSTTGPAKVSTR
jgi:hypothetical protein